LRCSLLERSDSKEHRKFTHRVKDIKPTNIFVLRDDDENPGGLLGDLGFAALLDDPYERRGSLEYAAPEALLSDADRNTTAMDMYGIGTNAMCEFRFSLYGLCFSRAFYLVASRRKRRKFAHRVSTLFEITDPLWALNLQKYQVQAYQAASLLQGLPGESAPPGEAQTQEPPEDPVEQYHECVSYIQKELRGSDDELQHLIADLLNLKAEDRPTAAKTLDVLSRYLQEHPEVPSES
jgi:serine/threonine protein kinase